VLKKAKECNQQVSWARLQPPANASAAEESAVVVEMETSIAPDNSAAASCLPAVTPLSAAFATPSPVRPVSPVLLFDDWQNIEFQAGV
jgi:hypothetical protein